MALLPGMPLLHGGEFGNLIYYFFIRNKHGLLIGEFTRLFKDKIGDLKETLGGAAGSDSRICFHSC